MWPRVNKHFFAIVVNIFSGEVYVIVHSITSEQLLGIYI